MKRFLTLLPLMLGCMVFTSCHRSSREVWEDTKTASRYVRRGFDSFLGRHVDEAPYAYDETLGNAPIAGGGSSEELDYLPLMSDEDRYVSSGHLAPARESPGEAGSSIPGIEAFSSPSGELARLFNNIHFALDTYSVKGHENVETLNAIADYMTKHPNVFVFIEGHADERGAAAYNFSLGSKRSNSVRGFLAERGVDPDRLFTISYGKERPISFGHDEGVWSLNRRAQFKIFEK